MLSEESMRETEVGPAQESVTSTLTTIIPSSSSKMKRLLVMAAVALFLVLLSSAYWVIERRSPYERAIDEFILYLCAPTEFSEGYSLEAWQQIRVGATIEEVKELLGEPLQESVYKGAREVYLRYANSTASTHFRQRDIQVTNGIVV